MFLQWPGTSRHVYWSAEEGLLLRTRKFEPASRPERVISFLSFFFKIEGQFIRIWVQVCLSSRTICSTEPCQLPQPRAKDTPGWDSQQGPESQNLCWLQDPKVCLEGQEARSSHLLYQVLGGLDQEEHGERGHWGLLGHAGGRQQSTWEQPMG